MDLFNQPALTRGPSLQSFATYRKLEAEVEQDRSAVNSEGRLLEYETLALRLHPPNTHIDNTYPDRTVLIIDSANRPGTLVEVVQCLAELQLSVKKARISSDGGWFVDEFHVTEATGGPVVDERKLGAIRQVLAVCQATTGSGTGSSSGQDAQTVFQIAGPEKYGVLADIMHLLIHNGCDICSAAAWTHAGRAAAVLGVKERGGPIADRAKVAALRKRLGALLSTTGDAAVTAEQVVGSVHHERRLHQLLLADAQRAWQQLTRLQKQESLPFPSSHLAALAAAAAAAGVDEEDDTATGRRDQQQKQQEWLRQERSPRTPAAVAAAWGAAWQKGHEEYVAALLQQRAGQKEQQQQQHPQQQLPRSTMAAAVAAGKGRLPEQQQKQQQAAPNQEQQVPTAPDSASTDIGGGTAAAAAVPPTALAHSQSAPMLPLLPAAAMQAPSAGMGDDSSSSSPPGMAAVLSMLTPVAEEMESYGSDSAKGQLSTDAGSLAAAGVTTAVTTSGAATQAGGQQLPAVKGAGGVFASAAGKQAAALAAGGVGDERMVHPPRPPTTSSSSSSSRQQVQGAEQPAVDARGHARHQASSSVQQQQQQQQREQQGPGLLPITTTSITSGGAGKGGSSRMPHLRVEVAAPTSTAAEPGAGEPSPPPPPPAAAAAATDGGGIRATLYSSKSLGSPRMVSAAAAAAAKVAGLQLGGGGPRSPLLPAAPAGPQQGAVPSPRTGALTHGLLSPSAAKATRAVHPTGHSSGRLTAPLSRGGSAGALPTCLPPRQHPHLPQQQQQQQQQVVMVLGRSPKHSEPEVEVRDCPQRGYWLVSIAARDRNKLLFDTVCTMSDMRYDVYHGTVDSEGEVAQQLFYVRPRFGPALWDEERAAQLRAMLEAAVQRRFPRGCKVHVFCATPSALSGSSSSSSSTGGGGRSSSTYLADLTAAFKKHQLSVTRCKVRAYGAPPSHTFYLLTASGALPSKAQVIQVCQAAGGELLEAPLLEGALLSGGGPGTAAVLRGLELRGHFGFYVRERRALVPASIVAAAGGSGVPGAGGRGQQQGGVGGSMRGGVERGGAVSVPAARGIACPAGRPGAAQSGGSSFDSDGGVDSF